MGYERKYESKLSQLFFTEKIKTYQYQKCRSKNLTVSWTVFSNLPLSRLYVHHPIPTHLDLFEELLHRLTEHLKIRTMIFGIRAEFPKKRRYKYNLSNVRQTFEKTKRIAKKKRVLLGYVCVNLARPIKFSPRKKSYLRHWVNLLHIQWWTRVSTWSMQFI